ncbi:MAG TPA: glycosyltransferase family 4 protein [Phycisphaerae bacterium]|nr:glycosyltransferase family 4 protein [Phycisphaerae bacterium]
MNEATPTMYHRPRVLVIGPMAPSVGGMTTVIEQLLTGPLSGSFEFVRHPANGAAAGWRSPLQATRRHLAQIARLARCICRKQVDVVHVHTCSGFTFYRNLIDAAVARWCGVPVVLHVHGAQFDDFCARSGRIGRWLIRRGLTRADRVVALSNRWRILLKPFAPEARFVVIPNGVPLPACHPEAAKPGGSGPCRFLFLAAICPRKGIDVLLNAASGLRQAGVPFHLTVAGPQERPGEARALDDEMRRLHLHDRITYVGARTGADKDALLDDCDCLVLPSRAEGLPLTLLEAGARGRAVVATDVGAVGEVITDDSLGLLVPPEDADRLTAAMRAMAEDSGRRRALGRALHARVAERFSLERQSSLLAETYRALCRRSSESAADVGPILATGGRSA